MAGHVANLATPRRAKETGDQVSPDAFPILWWRCAPSIERLARFDREQWRLDDGPIRRWRAEGEAVDTAGLEEHARILLAAVQHELAMRQSPLSPDEAWELNRSRKVALEALHRLGRPHGNRYAKTAHAELATPGVPLAVCVGSSYQRVVAGHRLRAQGCLAVFEDAPFGRGNMWPSWCPGCRPKNGRRNPARDQARDLRRKLRELEIEARRGVEHFA